MNMHSIYIYWLFYKRREKAFFTNKDVNVKIFLPPIFAFFIDKFISKPERKVTAKASHLSLIDYVWFV